MTEAPQEYITDALEMMGILEPKQIVTEVSGFIPVFEVVLSHYDDHVTALVFGRMWQYCRMSDGVCRATIDRLADDLKISGATVMRHIEKLEEGGYIYDNTPDRRNRPHEYVDCGKVIMKGSLSAIAQKNVRVAQKNVAIAESQLIKQDNTNIKQQGDISEPDQKQGTAYNRGEQERPNAVEEWLKMANMPGAKESARTDALLSAFGVAFVVNSETAEWKKFAKYAISEQKLKGWEPERFIKWVKAQQGYPQFWTCRRMLENYPKAFVEDYKPTPKTYNPAAEVEPEYVPAPPRKK